MLRILQYIEPLLENHDFVVIPTLGGFVASAQPAHNHMGMLYPPCKKVGFNPTLTYNDGLLGQAIAQHENCTLQKANQLLAQEALVLHQQLRLYKHLVVGKLGCLHLTETGIDFEPNANGIAVNTSYGLTPVYFPAITPVQQPAVPVSQPKTAIKKPLALPQRASSRFAVACVAAVLILLMIPVNFTRQQHESRAMFVPPAAFEEVVITPQQAPAEHATCQHYHAVIGSFSAKAKAYKFLSEIPSSLGECKIIYSEHRFRIVAASFATEEEGNAGIEQIAQAYPAYKDVWLLHYNP